MTECSADAGVGGLVVGVLRDEFAHDGQLQDGFAQFGDIFLDGVELAKMLGDKLLGALVLLGFGGLLGLGGVALRRRQR